MNPVRTIWVATRLGPRATQLLAHRRGLGVTRSVFNEDETRSDVHGWNVTHLNSGQALGKLFSERGALNLLSRLAALPIDWERLTFDEAVSMRGSEAHRAVAEAVEQVLKEDRS